MATKTYCDVCDEEIPDAAPVYCLGISQVRSGDLGAVAGAPATTTLEHICHSCARAAATSPPRPSPDSAVNRLLREPLTAVASRHLSGTSLVPGLLVDDVLATVAANAHAIAKVAR